MVRSEAQKWLKEIYRQPDKYERKVVAHLRDEKIVAVAETYAEVRRLAESLLTPEEFAETSYYFVPMDVSLIRIPTLRIRSLRESVWLPTYPVTLASAQSKLLNCDMLIDSGADISLIGFNAGNDLGLAKTPEEIVSTGIGVGGKIEYVLRRLSATIDGLTLDVSVAWCLNPNINELIIGKRDVFDAFNVEFRQSEKRIVFTPLKPK